MIELKTTIPTPAIESKLRFGEQLCAFGSCFSQTIGRYLQESGYQININPTGILYNPLSIANCIERLTDNKPFTADELFYHNDLHHSWMHHGSFSHAEPEIALDKINEAYTAGVKAFQKAQRLMITWGTAYVYYRKNEQGTAGEVVANCHKVPERFFIRKRATIDELLNRWTPFIERLIAQRPHLQILTTISPIRHLRDGAHGNGISKSTLMLFNEELLTLFPQNISYFPAYEIVMDELRDYRFYADDMTHPASITERIIIERITEAWLHPADSDASALLRNALSSIRHRPLHGFDSPERQLLFDKIRHQILALKKQTPQIAIPQEITDILDL